MPIGWIVPGASPHRSAPPRATERAARGAGVRSSFTRRSVRSDVEHVFVGADSETMADNSRIEWTEATWNPVTGCSKVSPGCAHCYAETFAERWRGTSGHPYEQGFDLRLRPESARTAAAVEATACDLRQLDERPVSRGHPRRLRRRCLRRHAPRRLHVFQILTKRQDRLAELASELPWPRNVWKGVSIENRRLLTVPMFCARSPRRCALSAVSLC